MDNLLVTDWNRHPEDWARYVGDRVREVWNTLPYDLRRRIRDDGEERAVRDWSDGIDAMGEDA